VEEEVRGGCRILHFEELYSLYSSSNIVRLMVSRSVRWAGRRLHQDESREESCTEF
jgi:hypothetical protein